MARALGFRFFDERHKEIEKALDLISVAGIVAPVAADVSSVTSLKSQPASASGGPLQMRIIAACDVKNPLLGETGATRTFGPQKGATSEQLEILERALTRLADTVTRELGCDFRNKPGAGAAGGLGFGLMSFCGAELRPGFDVVADAVELEKKIKSADVVITGEGKLDSQTLEGKAPAGVARLARKFGKRVFAVVGRAAADQQVREIFEGVYELRGSIPQARDLLRERARELGSALKY